MENSLVNIIKQSGVGDSTAIALNDSFKPFFDQAKEWMDKAQGLVVTDASQKDKMKQAREGRLVLRGIRVAADKTRKSLKEDSLKYGKAVQSVYNTIEGLITPIEKHLDEQERFVEIQAEKEKDRIRAIRVKEIEPYSEFVPFGIDLGAISDEDYLKLLSGAELQLKAREEEAKAQEQEEAKKKAEEERLKKENEALKAKIDAEEKVKRDAELKELEENERKRQEELKAKNAPDKEKLIRFMDQLKGIAVPELSNPNIKSDIEGKLTSFLSSVNSIISKL